MRQLIGKARPAFDRVAGLPLQSPITLFTLTLLALCHLGGMVAAVSGLPGLFLVSSALGLVADVIAERTQILKMLLDRSNLGIVVRSMIREFSFVVLVARLSFPDQDTLLVATMTFVVIVARATMVGADRQTTQIQAPRISTRNLQIEVVDENAPLAALPLTRICMMSSVPLIVGAGSILFSVVWPYLLAAATFAIFALSWTTWRMATLVSQRRRISPTATLVRASEEVAKLRPQAVLYFSGEPDAIYQVNMWLSTMEQLGVPVIVLLRERANLPLVGSTSLPIICIPGASDLMDFRLPTVRVAFYVAHVGKNIHLMREPRTKHVFIGHGESDKVASVNPVTKGFDEVWVAGRVSRERWAAAKVGVRDEAIVEVGRPQLVGIRRTTGMPTDRRISVLYAPTWEGWTSDPYSCSLITMGPSLIKWLLQQSDFRLIYKPHPFTGKVSSAARRAHAQVVSLIQASPDKGTVRGPQEKSWVEVQDRHLIVIGSSPTLYECFNHTDVLIGDISSVVSDFLSSGKPYVIPNPAARDHAEFRAASASARAGYLLDPRSETWPAVFLEITGTDGMREVRDATRLALLGPSYEDPVEPWRAATLDLITRANAEWPDAEREASRRADD